jgi:hypothetical protein
LIILIHITSTGLISELAEKNLRGGKKRHKMKVKKEGKKEEGRKEKTISTNKNQTR